MQRCIAENSVSELLKWCKSSVRRSLQHPLSNASFQECLPAKLRARVAWIWQRTYAQCFSLWFFPMFAWHMRRTVCLPAKTQSTALLPRIWISVTKSWKVNFEQKNNLWVEISEWKNLHSEGSVNDQAIETDLSILSWSL